MATVVFRDFEPRDLDFIHKCKNDIKLNSMVVGNWKPFTLEQSKAWLDGCIKADNPSYKFWAIATNDDEKRIVGWMSLSNIDNYNSSACHHGIFIGDKEYQDGLAMFESMLFSMDYAFNVIKIHRLYGCCLSEHKISPHLLKALGFSLEGVRRESVYKNNRFYDQNDYAILADEYVYNFKNGNYTLKVITKLFLDSIRDNKR